MRRTFLLLLVAFLPIVAFAYDAQIDGIYYDFSGYEAIVTYEDMDIYGMQPISDYSGSIVIPSTVTYNGRTYTVTSIGYGAFWACSGLTSITIPGSVTSIGNYAFPSCSGLTSITIPGSVTSIGDCAFASCRGLTSITIPNSVTNIGYNAFSGCSSLTSITIPNSVTSIGNAAFSSCIGLTSVEVEEGNTSYDSRANCNAVIETATNKLITGCQNSVIPNSVTSIGEWAFSGCSGLTSITIPNSVTSIGNHAFRECRGLTSVTIPGSVTSIGNQAFYNCSGLTSITIPNSVTSIGISAFVGCSSLTSVILNCNAIVSASKTSSSSMKNTFGNQVKEYIIGDDVTSIGGSTFYDCTSLTSVTIPNNVTSIGSYAFKNCSGLTSITIPNNVTSIGNSAFDGTAWYNNQPKGLVYAGKVAYKYKGSMPEGTQIALKDGTLGIAGEAFYGCTSLTSITIPNSVTSIGNSAFCGCQRLASITIPGSVTSIGSSAFSYCYRLTSITIPNSVTDIGSYVFKDCTGLTSVTIPESVTSIGQYAFYKCSGLTDVYCYADYVPSTESNAFKESSISSATLYVPASAIEQYRTTGPWSGFGSIVAVSSSTYTLTYMVDGETYKTVQYEVGESITPEEAPTKEDYTFSGWSEIPETMPNHDVTIIGYFTYSPSEYMLVDGTDYTLDSDVEVGKLMYSRYFKDTYWQTWYVPFDLTLTNEVMENFAFAKFAGTYTDEEGRFYITVIRLKEGDLLKANTPYCIQARAVNTQNPQVITQNDATLKAAVENSFYVLSVEKKVTFWGNYTNRTVTEVDQDVYAMNEGIYSKQQPGNTLSSFRCFFSIEDREDNPYTLTPNPAEVKLMVLGEDIDPDGIKSLTPTLSEGEGEWYDLSGHKIDNPTKGINIIRHSDGTIKKVMMK